jgi:transcriptional regulator with XRE-family HTH domain
MSEREWLDIFSENLRDMLRDAKMTQKELAYETGLAESSISGYLKGTKVPGIRAIVNISYALDCDFNDLLDFGEMIR